MIILNTHCVKNITQAWTDPDVIEKRDHIYRIYHGWMALPPAIIGFIFTLLFIAAVTSAIREHRVSRKFYALLLNRAFGDLLACVTAFAIIGYVLNNVVQVFTTLFTGCFWSAMVTYVSLGLLKLYGIARPLHYRNRVTMGRVKEMILFSWIAFFILVIITMSVTALVKIPTLSEWSGCTAEVCLTWMYRMRNGLTAFVYFFTIICFLVTVPLIRKARRVATSFHREVRASQTVQRRFRYPLIKLALNVGTFAIFHFPYTMWAVFLFFMPGCYFITHIERMQVLMGFVRFSLLLRICVDGAIGFYTDKELKRSLLSILGVWIPRIAPTNKPKFSMGIQASQSVGEISQITEEGDSRKRLTRNGKNGVEHFPNDFSKISVVKNPQMEMEIRGVSMKADGKA